MDGREGVEVNACRTARPRKKNAAPLVSGRRLVFLTSKFKISKEFHYGTEESSSQTFFFQRAEVDGVHLRVG